MDKNLTIIIAGETNAGKSTMMLQLEKLLTENGYNVELSFHGEPDYSGENSFHFHNKELKDFEKKIKTIKENTTIRLVELNHEALKNKIL